MSNDRDVIKSLEDALKIVDDSNLPSAPVSDRPFPRMSERSGPDSSDLPVTDKFGIPVTPKDYKDPEFTPPEGVKFEDIDWDFDLSDAIPTENEVPVGTDVILAKGDSYEPPPGGVKAIPRRIDPDLDVGSPEFKMKFDFESAYKDVPESRPLRLRREKRTGLVGGLLFALFIICVSVILASVLWMATVDVLGFASEDELVHVQVPPGFTMDGITDMLYEAGLIRHKALFALYAEYSNAIDKISEGSYVLNKNYDYRALVQGMTARAGVRVETTVTIPEGFTLAQIFTLLEHEGVCSAADLWEAATNHEFNFYFLERETLGNKLRLEGFLFPDTYNFFMDSTPTQAILRMLREFDRRFTEEYIDRAEDMGFTVREIITIASLIEREAGGDEERPRIAAVIYNRLNSPNFPTLDIDATIHYAIAGTTIPFSTQLDNEFNSYLHPGLPPGPIASPGMPSIRAALFPETTNEYFYALNRYGTHNFFTNYNDHVNFVNSDAYGG